MERYARIALEWFLARGERTEVRLDELLQHFATTVGQAVDEETREQAYRKAGLK